MALFSTRFILIDLALSSPRLFRLGLIVSFRLRYVRVLMFRALSVSRSILALGSLLSFTLPLSACSQANMAYLPLVLYLDLSLVRTIS